LNTKQINLSDIRLVLQCVVCVSSVRERCVWFVLESVLFIYIYIQYIYTVYIYTYTHTYIHTYIHTYTHTYIHTYILWKSQFSSSQYCQKAYLQNSDGRLIYTSVSDCCNAMNGGEALPLQGCC